MPFILCLLTALVIFSNFVRADEPPLRVAITPDSLRFAWPTGAARPHGVFVDKDGSIFIGGSETHRVRVWRK
jgi:hypothetical protein